MIGWPSLFKKKSEVVNQAESGTIALNDVEQLSDLFGITSTASGYRVTDKSALKVAIVYACCRLIGGAIAQMPKKVFITHDDTRKPVNDSPEATLLNLQPTAIYSAALFWERVVTQILLAGDSFSILIRNRNGVLQEVLPVDPGDVYVERKAGRLRYHIRFDQGQPIMVFDQDDILHFSNYGFNGLRAPSVIKAGAFNAIGTAMAMEDYSGDFFKNGSHQSIIIRKEGNWDEGQKEDVRNQWVLKYGGGVKNKKFPLVFDKSVGIDTVSVPAKDAQLLEGREFQVTDVARAFGLPSFMVNQEQKSTSWGTGVSEIGQVFLRYTLMPHVERMEQECNRKFFLRRPERMKFITAGLVKATIKERYESYGKALGGSNVPGFMAINEVRRLEDLPKIEGEEYDKPYIPLVGAVSPPDSEEGEDSPILEA